MPFNDIFDLSASENPCNEAWICIRSRSDIGPIDAIESVNVQRAGVGSVV